MGGQPDHHRRGVAAGAEAAGRQQGENPVRGGLTEADAESRLQVRGNRFSPIGPAADRIAQMDDPLPHRAPEDLVVEGGNFSYNFV